MYDVVNAWRGEFDDILRKATQEIESHYFLLPIDGGEPIFRERVYCYELYHQMRCLWKHADFKLSAEVDKERHPKATLFESKSAKPDLLVHGPGDMELNNTVIEVKPVKAKSKGIKKDIYTLTKFISEWNYERAVLLFYGDISPSRLQKRIKRFTLKEKYDPKIEIWLHANYGEKAYCLGSLRDFLNK